MILKTLKVKKESEMGYVEDLLLRASLSAQKSQMGKRHGAVLVINGRVISSGCNSERNCFKNNLPVSRSCHAEMAAIWAARRRLKQYRVLRKQNHSVCCED